MNNIINLTKLSWNNYLSIKKMTFFIIGAFSVAALVNPQFILMLIGMITYVIAYQTIAYEEMHKVNYLMSYLPIKKKEYIASRYLFSILSVIIGCMVFSIIYFISFKFNLPSIESIDYKISLYTGILCAVTLISILNPVIFYVGVEKARLATIAIFMVLVMIPSMLQDNDLINNIIIKISMLNIDILTIVYTVIILVISYLISQTLYVNKEIRD